MRSRQGTFSPTPFFPIDRDVSSSDSESDIEKRYQRFSRIINPTGNPFTLDQTSAFSFFSCKFYSSLLATLRVKTRSLVIACIQSWICCFCLGCIPSPSSSISSANRSFRHVSPAEEIRLKMRNFHIVLSLLAVWFVVGNFVVVPKMSSYLHRSQRVELTAMETRYRSYEYIYNQHQSILFIFG